MAYRSVGTQPEILNTYKGPQKIVINVITAGASVYVSTSRYALANKIAGQQMGTPITQANSPEALDVQGEIYWVGSADPTECDVLEAGAL